MKNTYPPGRSVIIIIMIRTRRSVPKAAWRRVAVTPPGRPTRRPGDATAYMTLEGPGCCHCRYDGGEEGKRKRKATDALDCRRCAGVDRPASPASPASQP